MIINQGFSGSTVQRKGQLVEKVSSDQEFISNRTRQNDLADLSRRLAVLPRIDHISGAAIYMAYVDGLEGLTELNARQAGRALRLLHEQNGYPHPCMTGVEWLVDMANENLAQAHHRYRLPVSFAEAYPPDALIHSEPTQLIEKADGSIVFIDFEGIGMGSRYHDLGFVYYAAVKGGKPAMFTSLLEGYQSEPVQLETARIIQLAGVISLGYAGFAEFEKRIELGLRLLGEK